MNTPRLDLVRNVLFLAMLCGCGCAADKPATRVAMAHGTLRVKNESDVDVFPKVQTAREESFGGVSVGTFVSIGFAAIEVNGFASVNWAEGRSRNPRKTVVFRIEGDPETMKRVKYLEFLYKGQDKWFLNLYEAPPRRGDKPLVAIPGMLVPSNASRPESSLHGARDHQPNSRGE